MKTVFFLFDIDTLNRFKIYLKCVAQETNYLQFGEAKQTFQVHLLLLALLVHGLEERTAHETGLGQGQRVEALSPREAQSGHHRADRVQRWPHVQVDGDRLGPGGVGAAAAAVEVDHIANLLAVGALHNPVVAVKGLGVSGKRRQDL